MNQSRLPLHHKWARLSRVHFFSLPKLEPPPIPSVIDLLKLSDETDLEILNHSMEVMVDCFQTELLPVATQLAARLVRSLSLLNIARFA